MYSSFHVKNFRGFKDLLLNDFANVNLIAGRNNTGKTALLEAILTYTGEYDASRLLRAPVPRYYRARVLGFMEIYAGDTGSALWKTLFHNQVTDAKIRFYGGIDDDPQLRQTQIFSDGESDGEEDGLEISVVNIDELSSDSRLMRFVTDEDLFEELVPSTKFLQFQSGREKPVHLAWSRRFYRDVRKPSLRYPAIFIPSSEMMPRHEVTGRFSELLIERRSESLLQVMKVFEPRLQALTLIGEPANIYGDLKDSEQLLPISSMGEGLRRIASLMLAIGTTEGGIVLIDEIENGLHYSIQNAVWSSIAETARKYNVQIFATTHSLEMIKAANEVFKERERNDFRLYRLDRETEDKEVRCVVYDKETLEAAIEVGFEVR